MMRTLCVATVVMGLAVGLAAPSTAAPPPPNPAPYNPVFSPGQVPAAAAVARNPTAGVDVGAVTWPQNFCRS